MIHAPVLFIDYCTIRDKYAFLGELGPALAPHPLHVLDGYRPGNELIPESGRAAVAWKAAPSGIFYRRSRWPDPAGWHAPRLAAPEQLQEYAERLAELSGERFPKVAVRHTLRCVRAAWHHAERAVTALRPGLVLVWNAFHPLSQAAIGAARAQRSRVAYLEYGVLPETINLDFLGQMGESAVALRSAEFRALPVTADDLTRTAQTLDELKRSGLNRRAQPARAELEGSLQTRARGRPIVFFAGHNEYASGVRPYDARARSCHSPLFDNCSTAVAALAEHARLRGWFVVYKPHPFASNASQVREDDSVAVIQTADINECIDAADVVVTVLSQVSYVALIRGKPVVMLGHNQLRDHGCAYEPGALRDVEPCIAAALSEGFTNAQREAWQQHVARLLRYYLYRYKPDSPHVVAAQPAARMAEVIRNALVRHAFVDFAAPWPRTA